MVLPFYNISNETMLKIKAFLEGFDSYAGPVRPVTSENCKIEQIFKDDPFRVTFFTEITDAELHELVDAANFMDIKPLFESCCCAIAILLK